MSSPVVLVITLKIVSPEIVGYMFYLVVDSVECDPLIMLQHFLNHFFFSRSGCIGLYLVSWFIPPNRIVLLQLH